MNPAELKSAELVQRVKNGQFSIAQARGCRGFHICRLRDGFWTMGAKLNTNAARAAVKQLTEVGGVHLIRWDA